MKYLSVVVDNNTNATDELYTYGCDIEGVSVGARVTVSFGTGNRIIDAYVISVSDEAPKGIPVSKIKKILEIDSNFSLTEEEIDTALWMRRRCLCRYIEAVKCFLPSFNSRNGRSKDPFADLEVNADEPKELTDDQENAVSIISSSIAKKEFKTFLLHGVTGSGKTEVYLQAMAETLARGLSGIVLVPEISLTPQTVSRFVNRFGKEKIAVIHSKLTPAQKDREYHRIKSGEAKLVIGARSAIFAPLENIGLIVIDEEHETSYKSDSSPKYDAIEVANKRAMAHNAVLVLGSATPSVGDFFRAKTGLFTLISLPKRYNSVPLPKTEIIDMTKEVKSGNRNMFSSVLASEIKKCLDNKKQVILFLNRRGYSSHVSCRECGYVVACPECGIAMPYHKESNACVCHYCGRKTLLPKQCPSCQSKIIGMYGIGTEQVEENVKTLFPEAKVERLDLDTVKKKGSLESQLKRFAKGKIDILVGTQLIAKGIDVAGVGLVGIISADVSLNIPDFRSSERSFQLMTQAAGRAGRGNEQGKVIIQTYQKDNFAVRAAAVQDYNLFFERELEIRKAASYPPFTNVYQLIVADESMDKAANSSKALADNLRSALPSAISVLGPSLSLRQKLGGMYRYQILVKAEAKDRKEIGALLESAKEKFVSNKAHAKVITIDINPYSFL